jgi:hypothetical protein
VEDLVRARLAHFEQQPGSESVWAVDSEAQTNKIPPSCRSLTPRATGKYGALSTEAGRGEIRWRMTRREPFTMRWTEKGWAR